LKKRILHLASFNGNVGDVLNHQGFYKGIEDVTGLIPEIDHLEIRDFYRGIFKFDDSFVNLVNQYDSLIIGGGNYFELWVDHSPTGTSIMIEPEILSKIKVPILFNALGVDLGQGVTKSNVLKFKEFLDAVFSNPKHIISVRNDGALKNLEFLYGNNFTKNFLHTPDAGFYADFSSEMQKTKSCLINLSGDMLETRYPGGNMHTPKSFLKEFVLLIEHLCKDKDFDELTFIPHIYKDIAVISSLLELLPDKIVREKCRVAELNLGNDISRYKKYYEEANMVIANRFHSNISALKACGTVVAIENYVQITNLYEELGMKEKLLSVKNHGFAKEFSSKIHLKGSYENNTSEINALMSKQYFSYINKVLHLFV
tara:strand:- start:1556 stop:2665 length:1110 start_codon:yes stop_codon:yes gene_type:complete